jgi:hypothetical protein
MSLFVRCQMFMAGVQRNWAERGDTCIHMIDNRCRNILSKEPLGTCGSWRSAEEKFENSGGGKILEFFFRIFVFYMGKPKYYGYKANVTTIRKP